MKYWNKVYSFEYQYHGMVEKKQHYFLNIYF